MLLIIVQNYAVLIAIVACVWWCNNNTEFAVCFCSNKIHPRTLEDAYSFFVLESSIFPLSPPPALPASSLFAWAAWSIFGVQKVGHNTEPDKEVS